jgi:phosphatidate cytidylyltransferase
MQRLLTAAVGVPLVLAAIFLLPEIPFFVVMVAVFGLGTVEYVRLLQHKAPHAPLWLLYLWVPAAAAATLWCLLPQVEPRPEAVLLVGGIFLTCGLGTLLLLSPLPADEVPAALGIVGFGVPYFAMPMATVAALQALDPWLIILLLAIVWLGDTAAYYVGSALGRHKMAPRVSPNKSWEGAIAGFAVGVLATIAWSFMRLGELHLGLLGVAAVTAVAAQVGDLVESLLKRSVQVKDSGSLLPGHGGMLDRMDALLFATPVLLLGLWLLGFEGLVL